MAHRAIREENQITQGVIWKQLLFFFFPILLGTFFQQMYNTVDAVVVGNFVGKEALAAVGGATGTLINLLVGFFVGLSSGATVIIAQFHGARDGASVSRAVHTAMALGILSGLFLTVVGIACAPWALGAMGTPEDILDYSITYMRIYFTGTIPSLVYNIGSGILRAMGDSRRPLYFLIIACLVNIVLDLIFVLWLNMGVVGVALATVLSQVASMALVLVTLLRTQQSCRLYWRQIRITPPILNQIVRIGLPAGLQSVMYSISNVIIQSNINSFGTDTVAAWTAYGKIDCLFWMIMGAFGISITTFVGQNFGARQYDRIDKSVRVCMLMALGFTVPISALLPLIGDSVYRLFTPDAVVIEKGMHVLRTLVPFYATFICVEILSGAVRGAGDSLRPTLMTCFGICVLRILWLFIVVPLHNDLTTVILSYPITWIVTSVLFVVYYLRKNWLKRRIREMESASAAAESQG